MAEYTFDVQKLYIEMLLADAESFARAQNIFKPESFDRKLQPIAKFVKDYMDEYKVMPEVDIVNASHDIKLKSAKDLSTAFATKSFQLFNPCFVQSNSLFIALLAPVEHFITSLMIYLTTFLWFAVVADFLAALVYPL